MDNKKVWIVENCEGRVVVCSSEGSAYRRVLHYYVELLAGNLANIRERSDVENMDNVEHVYETIIYDLKSLTEMQCIDEVADMREAELVD